MDGHVVVVSGGESKSDNFIVTAREYLLNKRPELPLLDLDEYSYKMVYAPIQSGKTSMMVCKALEHALDGRVVILVVRNFKMDLEQLMRRINESYSVMNTYGGGSEMEILTVNQVRKTDLLATTKQGCIIVMMANTTQFKELDKKMNKIENKKEMVMMIDEVDDSIKSESSKLGNNLMTVEWNIVQRVGVTATAMGLLYSDVHLRSSQLIIIKPCDNYKGVQKDALQNNVMKKQIEIQQVQLGKEEMYKVYTRISSTDFGFVTKDKEPHPVIILNKTKHEKEDHLELAWEMYEYFQDDYPGESKYYNDKFWFHVIVNGDGVQVITDLELFDEEGEYYSHSDGIYMMKMDIATCLSAIKRNIEQKYDNIEIQRTVINVIGGKCFSRGVSLVSLDYSWHLTHEYYLPSNATVCGSILQALRLCGVYKDNIPLRLYTTENVRNHIYAYSSIQEKLIQSLSKSSKKNMRDILDTFAVNEREAIIKRRIGKGKDGDQLKIHYNKASGVVDIRIVGDPLEVKKQLKSMLKPGAKLEDKDLHRENGIHNLDTKRFKVIKTSAK